MLLRCYIVGFPIVFVSFSYREAKVKRRNSVPCMFHPTVCKKRCYNFQQGLAHFLILPHRIKARTILGSEVPVAVYGGGGEHTAQDGQEEL